MLVSKPLSGLVGLFRRCPTCFKEVDARRMRRRGGGALDTAAMAKGKGGSSGHGRGWIQRWAKVRWPVTEVSLVAGDGGTKRSRGRMNKIRASTLLFKSTNEQYLRVNE
ncbi:hypothetical protein Droror1_Dr00009049 [Drosera rotundifolia]